MLLDGGSSRTEKLKEQLGLSNTVVLPPHPPQRKVRVRYQHPTKIVPVTAIHMAQEIDLDAIIKSVFSSNDVIQRFGKTSIVVRLAKNDEDKDIYASNRNDEPASEDGYVAIYRFGSIIFFNMDDDHRRNQVSDVVRQVQQHARQPALFGSERTETFAVHVSPDHPAVARSNSSINLLRNSNHDQSVVSSVVTGDYCIVPEIDIKGVAVISNILAQSVALENYGDMIEKLLRNFERINQTVQQTGSFPTSDAHAINFLFKTVSQNNSIYLDIVSKIRIKNRADTAWDFVKYESIHYGLKEEFEIEERFESIEFKLNLIQQNSEFFLQILQEENSSTLEWIIIALICLEGVLMIVEMSGLGEAFFQSWLSDSALAMSHLPQPPATSHT